MKIQSYIFLFLLAIFTTLLDTSFFSNLSFFGATILSTLSILIVLSILERTRASYLFAAFATLCYATFSSLSVYLLTILFLGIPFGIAYLKSKLLIEFNLLLSIFVILIAEFIFILVATAFGGGLTLAILKYIASFMTINTLTTIIVFVLGKKLLLGGARGK
ncbi:hypothetical protein A2215_04815 [Candidatus Berkelbacteria bacterium RIFOXYA2_FULL_43_10]|uniref:Rod shape-determining protein MreD n=1 Tax=Candidatus Berkelbacteria bacterium RIFOXYA2_FULL_43_10 TaxID=1797472 RepID=A0A1F5E5P7_9BACT|nr:MAG: hypothetical protein A2215_04815 [Candidatus Berkelbacteria bacterium RIFOXYA2_FULL_43_10]